MTLRMHNLSSSKRALSERDRHGRGDASGDGNYCGRGQKGQKSRSGVGGLKRIGMKHRLIAQTPKLRGFKSHLPRPQAVNLERVNNNFREGEEVSRESLAKVGLVDHKKGPVKILGDGELTVKKLIFSGVSISKGAREKIEKAEGVIKKEK